MIAPTKLSPTDLAYHERQHEEPYRQTWYLAEFIRVVLGVDQLTGRVVDVGCGGGANLHWLDVWGLLSGCELIGVDSHPEVVTIARERLGVRATVLSQDFRRPLPSADYALSIQTLSFIDSWRIALPEILRATRRWAFVSSLFWSGIETRTLVYQAQEKKPRYYNVIDRQAFEHEARRCGALEVRWQEFVIDKDLEHDATTLGTRTIATLSEDLLQFSGPLYMPWAFAAIRMS